MELRGVFHGTFICNLPSFENLFDAVVRYSIFQPLLNRGGTLVLLSFPEVKSSHEPSAQCINPGA